MFALEIRDDDNGVCGILSQAGTTWNGALSCAREIQPNKSEVSKIHG